MLIQLLFVMKRRKPLMSERIAKINRKTRETDIEMVLNLDGKGTANINTGVGFFDHMLDGFSRHGFFDLQLKVKGDLEVDDHHTIEDTGIVLGTAIKEAIADKKGIKRYGSTIIPMDETMIMCAIDLCGRPYLSMNEAFLANKVGDMETTMVREFFYAISYSAGMNIHIKILDGHNAHHIIEAIFKSFARALDEATSIDPRITDVLSTKGSLS